MTLSEKNYNSALMYGARREETDTNLDEGNIVVGDANGVGSEVAISGDATLSSAGVLTVAADAIDESKVPDSDGATGGLFVKKVGMAVYDFSVDGGSSGEITLDETCTIPDNALVTAWHYDVLTTCQSSGDSATIALSLPTDGALSTAIAISDGTDPWDAGAHLASEITPLAVKTTDARAVGITVATEDLTAGKIVFYVEYAVSA